MMKDKVAIVTQYKEDSMTCVVVVQIGKCDIDA